jgi:hypothetical protein
MDSTASAPESVFGLADHAIAAAGFVTPNRFSNSTTLTMPGRGGHLVMPIVSFSSGLMI